VPGSRVSRRGKCGCGTAGEERRGGRGAVQHLFSLPTHPRGSGLFLSVFRIPESARGGILVQAADLPSCSLLFFFFRFAFSFVKTPTCAVSTEPTPHHTNTHTHTRHSSPALTRTRAEGTLFGRFRQIESWELLRFSVLGGLCTRDVGSMVDSPMERSAWLAREKEKDQIDLRGYG
jgi:hypothetical protein